MKSASAGDLERLEVAVLRAARSIRRAWNERLKPLGMNFTEGSLLWHLRDKGSLSQTELAGRLHVGKAVLGTYVDGLAERGLVERNPSPGDRRVWLISLTPAADQYVDAFEEVDKKLRDDLRSGLSRDQRHMMAEGLLRMESNLSAEKPSAVDS